MSNRSYRKPYRRKIHKPSTLTAKKHLYNLVYGIHKRGGISPDEVALVRTWLTNEMSSKENFYCVYCATILDFVSVSVDHDVPVSRSGKNNVENMVLCCKWCNKAKGSMTGEEFRRLMMTIGEFEDEGKTVLRRLVASGNMYRRWGKR